jgi:hypothetical protein
VWLVFILLSFGGYFKPYRIVGHLPGFPFRAPSRFLLINTFAVSGLAAIGFERLLGKKGALVKILAVIIIIGSIIFQQQRMFKNYYEFVNWNKINSSFVDLASYKMTSPLYVDKNIKTESLYGNQINVFRDEFVKGLIIAIFSLGILYFWWKIGFNKNSRI